MCFRNLPQYTFTVGEWNSKRDKIEDEFASLDWNKSVIVRSSSLSEDTSESSQAGKYESVANVSGKTVFCSAVEQVIASYDDDN